MAEKKTKAKKAVVTNKKTSINKWQVVALVILMAFFVISLLTLWLYASNKPNYRDLEKAYNKLNIPSDWQLVSQSSNKGLWGIFCSSGVTDTSPCPQISKEYLINDSTISLKNSDQIISNISAEYNSSSQEPAECNSIGITNKIRCSKTFITQNGVNINISLADQSSRGQDGLWAYILISQSK